MAHAQSAKAAGGGGIVTDQKDNVLKVPNPALRVRPAGATGGQLPQSPAPAQGAGEVWVFDAEDRPQAVAIRLGATDGPFREVLAGALSEGQRVIIGSSSTAQPSAQSSGGLRWRF